MYIIDISCVFFMNVVEDVDIDKFENENGFMAMGFCGRRYGQCLCFTRNFIRATFQSCILIEFHKRIILWQRLNWLNVQVSNLAKD